MTSDDGVRAIITTGLRHPMLTIAMVAGLVSGAFVAGTGYAVLQGQLSELSRNVERAKHGVTRVEESTRQEIRRVERDMKNSVGTSADRMERLSSDVGEMKASVRGIETAIQFLVAHQRQQNNNRRHPVPE